LDKIREVESAQKFKDILNIDAPYSGIISKFEPNVMQVYDELIEITKALKPYLDILEQATKLKVKFTNDSAGFFQEMITELKGQLEVVDAMPQTMQYRLVEIQLKKIEDKIVPVSCASLNKLRGYVSGITLEKAQVFDEKVSKIFGSLSEEYRGLFHFGDQYELYLNVSNDKNIYREDFHRIQELWQLLDAEAFPIPIELIECVRALGPKYSAFESLMIKIGEQRGANARK